MSWFRALVAGLVLGLAAAFVQERVLPWGALGADQRPWLYAAFAGVGSLDQNRVQASPAFERIGAESADERVVVRSAVELVKTCVASEEVVSGNAAEQIAVVMVLPA